MSFHEHTDVKFARRIRQGAPDTFSALTAFEDAALKGSDMAIPRKYAELMAIAVALTTQCPHCIEGHSMAAHAEGATDKELAETVFIATALRGGGGFTHGWMAMKFFEQAEQKASAGSDMPA